MTDEAATPRPTTPSLMVVDCDVMRALLGSLVSSRRGDGQQGDPETKPTQRPEHHERPGRLSGEEPIKQRDEDAEGDHRHARYEGLLEQGIELHGPPHPAGDKPPRYKRPPPITGACGAGTAAGRCGATIRP